MTRWIIEVTLSEDDPSEVLDWIIEHSGDENASVMYAPPNWSKS